MTTSRWSKSQFFFFFFFCATELLLDAITEGSCLASMTGLAAVTTWICFVVADCSFTVISLSFFSPSQMRIHSDHFQGQENEEIYATISFLFVWVSVLDEFFMPFGAS